MTWDYAYTPMIWPSIGTAFLTLALSIYSWQRRSVSGALQFAIYCLIAIPMLCAKAMGYSAIHFEAKVFWFKMEMAWWLPLATAMTCFLLEYAWPGRWLTRRNLALLSIAPLFGGFLLLADSITNLTFTVIAFNSSIVPVYGPYGRALWVYALGLTLLNIFTSGWLFARSPQHRWPVVIILSALLIARARVIFNAFLPDALLLYVPEFAINATACAIALFRFRILDPIPLARQTVVQQIHVGMLVLDAQKCVVSLNLAAESMLSAPAKQVKGRPIRELLPAYPQELSGDCAGHEIAFSLKNGQASARCYSLEISPLKDWRGLEAGRLLLLRDVTEQKQAQAQILEQQRALAALQERELLARELHDSLGQTLGYINLQVQAIRKRVRDGDQATIDAQLARLAEVAQEAHQDIRESILNLRGGPSEPWRFFTALQQYLNSYQNHYGIRAALDCPADLDEDIFEPGASMQLLRVIQEAMTNARKHGRASCAQVTFDVEKDAGQVRVTITDDGCGFDPAEAAHMPGDHFGLTFMRERVEKIGGRLSIKSQPGAGTQVLIEAPARDIAHGL